MKLVPLNDKIVIRRAKSDMVSAGGIILPDAEKKKSERGEVLAVGPGFRATDGSLHPMQVKIGDMIFFSKYAGQEIEIPGNTEKLLVISESEVQAIIKQE